MRSQHVSWGQSLLLAVREAGGLNRTVGRINTELGPFLGTRNTFAKLYTVEDPRDLDTQERFRAWVLLVAIGEDPTEWGIEPDAVPPSIDRRRLARVLPQRSTPGNPVTKVYSDRLQLTMTSFITAA